MLEMNIPVDGKKGNFMVRGYTLSLMEAFTKAVSKMVKDMAKEPIHGRMEINMLVNSGRISYMVKVHILGQMGHSI